MNSLDEVEYFIERTKTHETNTTTGTQNGTRPKRTLLASYTDLGQGQGFLFVKDSC